MSRTLIQTEHEMLKAERERVARRGTGWLSAVLRRFSPSDHTQR